MERPIPLTIATGQLGLGGGERQLYLALRGLDRAEFAPSVVTFNPGRGDHWEGPIRALGVPLFEVPRSANKARRVAELARLLRRIRPRIVHGWDFPLNGAVALGSRLAGVRIRIGGVRRNLFKPGRGAWRRRLATTGLDRFVVNSLRGRDDLLRCGVGAERIDVVHNAVELPQETLTAARRADLRCRYGVEREDEVVIANVSNMIPVKNHALLLDATRRLLARGLSVRTVVYGDGPLREELERSAGASPLDGRVRFMGRDPGAPAAIAAADVFCFTSRSEGCPNVLLEAAAAGLPAVTTDVGGASEIVVEGETGHVVPSDDPAALAAALEGLVQDRERRARMGAAARARIEREFTPQRSVAALVAAYDSALRGSGR
jgi:glycosyltransferase involved in cell wall biosynthesis